MNQNPPDNATDTGEMNVWREASPHNDSITGGGTPYRGCTGSEVV